MRLNLLLLSRCCCYYLSLLWCKFSSTSYKSNSALLLTSKLHMQDYCLTICLFRIPHFFDFFCLTDFESRFGYLIFVLKFTKSTNKENKEKTIAWTIVIVFLQVRQLQTRVLGNSEKTSYVWGYLVLKIALYSIYRLK